MQTTSTVFKTGNSAAIALPAAWRKRHGVCVGDKLRMDALDDGRIVLEKHCEASRSQAIAAFLSQESELPDIPWTRGDSKKDDRALLAERYA